MTESALQSPENILFASNGKPVHPTLEGMNNFSRWFKHSRVRDLNGYPQVMYHGTFNSFDSFDKKKIGTRFASDVEGFFAISCPKEASEYATEKDLPGNVMPVFVSLQNPLIVDKAFLASEGMQEIGPNESVVTFWDNYQALILEWSDERNCDGVMLIDSSKLNHENILTMSIAFSPKQIKSALGNSGAFNPKSASLTDTPTISPRLKFR